MLCKFDQCEFYNILFGGIIVGIIASFLYVLINNTLEWIRFTKLYKNLSSNHGQFDWTAYSMSKENGRIRNTSPNGSIANVTLEKRKIKIALKHEERKWIGEVQMQDFGFGILTLKYENKMSMEKETVLLAHMLKMIKLMTIYF